MRISSFVIGAPLALFCHSTLADPYLGLRVMRSEQEATSLGRVGNSYTVEDTHWRLNMYAGYSFKYLDVEVGGGPLGRRYSHNVSSTFDIHQDDYTNYIYGGVLPEYRMQNFGVHAIVALARVKMKNHEYGSNENGPNQEYINYATDTAPMLGVGFGYAVAKRVALRFDFFRINNVAKSSHTNSRDVIVYGLSAQYSF